MAHGIAWYRSVILYIAESSRNTVDQLTMKAALVVINGLVFPEWPSKTQCYGKSLYEIGVMLAQRSALYLLSAEHLIQLCTEYRLYDSHPTQLVYNMLSAIRASKANFVNIAPGLYKLERNVRSRNTSPSRE